MSATSRPLDFVRDAIRDNVLTAFLPAFMWNEALQPFTTPNANIIVTKQKGVGDEAFIRVHDVQVMLFTAENCDVSDVSTLLDQANAACDYVRDVNFILVDADTSKIERVIEHVTGPYQTVKNRYFYRFTVRVLS